MFSIFVSIGMLNIFLCVFLVKPHTITTILGRNAFLKVKKYGTQVTSVMDSTKMFHFKFIMNMADGKHHNFHFFSKFLKMKLHKREAWHRSNVYKQMKWNETLLCANSYISKLYDFIEGPNFYFKLKAFI